MKFKLFNLFKYEADKGTGGGGSADPAARPPGDKGTGGNQHLEDIVKQLKADNDAMKARLDEMSKPPADRSLIDRVADDKKARDKTEGDTKALENALTFTLRSSDFLKENEAVLPKDMAELFKAAEKEKYESPVQKANAIKAAMIQSFFQLQANMDILTPSLKTTLEDYLKLTKNGKEEKAQQIFENVFEPALAMVKNIKKAEEISRSKMGYGNPSDSDRAYKEKLMGVGRKHYLGEKENRK